VNIIKEVKRMRNLFFGLGLIVIVAMMSGNALGAPIITNGDFEDVQIGSPFHSNIDANIPGWTRTGDRGDGLLWAIGFMDGGGHITTAGHGNQFVTLGYGFHTDPASAAWSTTITGLTPGSMYELDFMIATEGETSSQTLGVGFTSGSSTASQSFTSGPSENGNYWMTWESEIYNFVATADTATVQFFGTIKFDIGLDYVRVREVSPVPVPGTMLLLGSGLAGLAALRKKLRV
jgi:hypothetical protein